VGPRWIWQSGVVDDHLAGATNLGGFVAATAGRNGFVQSFDGGVTVAGPIRVVNGYVNAAVARPDAPVSFVNDATAFFARLERPFVMWVPDHHQELLAAVRLTRSAH
jgi:hypothetical protein